MAPEMLWEDREWTEGEAVPESDLQAGTGLISHASPLGPPLLSRPHIASNSPSYLAPGWSISSREAPMGPPGSGPGRKGDVRRHGRFYSLQSREQPKKPQGASRALPEGLGVGQSRMVSSEPGENQKLKIHV